MEMPSCSPFQLQGSNSPFNFDCDALLGKTYNSTNDSALDAGYFSACSSLSPTSSVDSFCFSPAALQGGGHGQDILDCFIFNNPAASLVKQELYSTNTSATTSKATKKSRSRYPGKKRQTASEREKLRMRDLTKALQHVRTYLPPSVAPAGQTLTKIETLRLTIRYISYLSAQLGLTDEVLSQRASCSSMNPNQVSAQAQNLSIPAAHNSSQELCGNTREASNETFTCQQSLPNPNFSLTQLSYQIPSDIYHAPRNQDRWMPHQHPQEIFSRPY